MRSASGKLFAPLPALLCALLLGCAAPSPVPSPTAPIASKPRPFRSEEETHSLTLLAHTEPESTLPLPTLVPANPNPQPPTAPFAGTAELSVDALVKAVLERNPTVAEMTAAWQAAQARYPQVTSLDDPLFGTNLSPALGSRVGNGWRVEVFQRYQWPGKLRLRGEEAMAEANAAGREVENVRQQLIESAADAFYDYYLSERGREVNAESLRLLQRIRANIADRYQKGKALEQDLRQAEVEIGRLRERDILLERQRKVATARIDTLLHLPPTLPLPPPPKSLPVEGELPDPQMLLSQALAQRLDLLQLSDRIKAAEAAVKLAYREYYPDVDAMAAYDAFWDNPLQRGQVAFRFNLPVRMSRRRGAVTQAEATLKQLQAQYARQTDQAGFEVQQAYEQWRESLQTIQLFDKDVLPAARRNLESAQRAYSDGLIPFFTLIEAQRSLLGLLDRYYQATSDYFRRRTAAQRSLTGTPAITPIPMIADRPGPGQPGYPTGMGIGAR